MSLKYYRWSKKLLIIVAALPMLQATGCDLLGASSYFAQDFNQNLAFGVFSSVVRGISSTLLGFYPSADLLQTFLGGNTTQFIQN